MRNLLILMVFAFLVQSCDWYRQKPDTVSIPANDTLFYTANDKDPEVDTLSEINEQWNYKQTGTQKIDVGNTKPEELLNYAKSLIGVPYKYASSDPKTGFDCSGFITYVFNHFKIAVPRSSVDFTTVEKPINIRDATAGDLILFTGTDSTIRTVGHMGIITSRKGEPVTFIHSTSGKEYGVTITPLNAYYQGRYAGIRRVF